VTLTADAVAVLAEADPAAKAAAARAMAERRRAGASAAFGDAVPPDRPARPARPDLLPPRLMPKRGRAQTLAGRIALLHALAHIELNAIDLACDLIARFGGGFPAGFADDWTTVAAEEALHFTLLTGRLAEYGAAYGDLPAHDGLWQAAAETADDPLARLAIVPLVLEARGLDVTPPMIASLRKAGDARSATVLERIYDDEIGHVAVGRRWFDWLCGARGLEPKTSWQALVRRHFRDGLKRPFNAEARSRAGLAAPFYEPLAGD
jgi:uncharacterized ferritin-like protein (DUF455 family)